MKTIPLTIDDDLAARLEKESTDRSQDPSQLVAEILRSHFASQPPHHRAISKTLDQLRDLRSRPAGWNGYDAAKPDSSSIDSAQVFIAKLYDEIEASRLRWIPPHVTADAHGHAVFEWWCENRKVTVYLGCDGIEYIKVWGADIDTEMEDGTANASDERGALWRWLLDNP